MGKGTGNRAEVHEKNINHSYEGNKAKKQVIRRILAAGKRVLIKKLAEFSTEEEAYAFEAKVIEQYKGSLTNANSGGSGSLNSRIAELPQVPSTEDRYLTYEQAASIVGVHRGTFEEYVKIFGIPRYRRGLKQVVFNPKDVECLGEPHLTP